MQWTILNSEGGLSGFDISDWTIDTAQFANGHSGTFSLSADANNVYLNYTPVPEPEPVALLGGAAILGLGGRLRRRRA